MGLSSAGWQKGKCLGLGLGELGILDTGMIGLFTLKFVQGSGLGDTYGYGLEGDAQRNSLF